MKENKEIVKWEENLLGGIQYMKDFAEPTAWNTYRNYYRGIFTKGNSSARKYSVSIIFAILRSMIPQIYFTNPRVVVTNEVPGFYLQSKIVQKIDNKLIRSTKVKQQLKEIIKNAALCGTAPLLTGFDSEYGYDPSLKEKMTDEVTGEQIEIGGTLVQFDEKTGNRLEYNDNIKPGKPWVAKVRPEYFIIPYGYERLAEAPWVARLYVRRLEDVKKDPRLINTKDLTANAITTFDWFKEQKLHQQMPDNNYGDFVFLWEIRDLKTGKMIIMQQGHKKFLHNELDYLQKFGNPYMELTFNSDPITFWGLPDSKYLEDQQLAINEARTLQMETRRIAKLRFMYDENVIEPEEVMKVITEDVGCGIKVNGSPRDAVSVFQPYVPADFNIDVDAIRKDAREISGLSRNQTGEFEGGRKTATETQIVNMASQIRVSERKDMLADLLVDIIGKYNQYIFSEWNTTQVEDIIGPDGKRYWVSFTHDQIDSKYNFRVDPESGTPVSADTRRQEAIMVSQYLQNSPVVQLALQAGQPIPYNLAALDRFVIEQFEGIPVEEIMPPSQGAGNNPEQPLPLQELQKRMNKGGQ